jgi:signal transduction histidine kinase
MEIRRKLTYQFIGMVAFILLFSLVAIYVSFSQSRKEEFYDRLGSKAKLVAQMLIDIDEIDSDLLKKIEKNNPLSLSGEKIVIFDYENKQIYSTDEDTTLIFPISFIKQVRLKTEVRFRQKEYEVIGQYYTGQSDRIVVFAAATDIFGINKLQRLRIIMLFVFIASLVIVFIAGRIFAMRALEPISNIVKQVNRIEVTNLNARLDKGNEKDEIAHLAQTFNKMLERLEVAFMIQKSFIANASHELRTPLTVITGQLEVVLMKARTNEEYKNTLILVLNEIKNLNLLSNKLLLLAQTSTKGSDVNFLPTRIDDVLWKAQKEVLTRNKNYIVEIMFGDGIDDESKLSVLGNELLLKTALTNLMDNACKYSENHYAEVRLNATDKELSIQFIDQGIGIPKEELELIFHPFFRSKNVIHVAGHGIGLSLVEKIVAQHKGSIYVSSEIGKGSVFTLQIPIIH